MSENMKLEELILNFDTVKTLENQFPKKIFIDGLVLNTETGELTGRINTRLDDIHKKYLAVVALLRWTNPNELSDIMHVSKDAADYHLISLVNSSIINKSGENYFIEQPEKIFEESKLIFNGGFLNERTGVLKFREQLSFLTEYQAKVVKEVIKKPIFADELLREIKAKSTNPHILNKVIERINQNFETPLLFYDSLEGRGLIRISLAGDIKEETLIEKKGAKIEIKSIGNEMTYKVSFNEVELKAKLTKSESDTLHFIIEKEYVSNKDLMSRFYTSEKGAKKKILDLEKKIGFIKRRYYEGTHYYYGDITEIMQDKAISYGMLSFNPVTGIISYGDKSLLLIGDEEGYALNELIKGTAVSELWINDAEYKTRNLLQKINEISQTLFLKKEKDKTYLTTNPTLLSSLSGKAFIDMYHPELPLWSQTSLPLETEKIKLGFREGEYWYSYKKLNIKLSELEAAYTALFMRAGTIASDELEEKFGVIKASVLSLIRGLKNKGLPIIYENNLEHSVSGFYFDGLRDISEEWIERENILLNVRSGLVNIQGKKIRLNPEERKFIGKIFSAEQDDFSVLEKDIMVNKPINIMENINRKLNQNLILYFQDSFFLSNCVPNKKVNSFYNTFDPTVPLKNLISLPIQTNSFKLGFDGKEYFIANNEKQEKLTERQAQTAAVFMNMGFVTIEEIISLFHCGATDAQNRIYNLNIIMPGFLERYSKRSGGYIFTDGSSHITPESMKYMRTEFIQKIKDYDVNSLTGITEYEGKAFYLTETQEKILTQLNYTESSLEEITSIISGKVYKSDLKSAQSAIEDMIKKGCKIYKDRSQGRHKHYSLKPILSKKEVEKFKQDIDLIKIYGSRIQKGELCLETDTLILYQGENKFSLTYREAQYMSLLIEHGNISADSIAENFNYTNHKHVTSVISNLRYKGVMIGYDLGKKQYYLPKT